jgi:hypothetical protein
MPRKKPKTESGKVPRTVNLPLQTREVSLLPGTVDAEARTIEVVWSAGATVRRRDLWTGKRYDEVLSLEPEHVDLSRLNGGAPLLDTHGAWSLNGVIGVVERAWIAPVGDGHEGRALVRFSEREEVDPIWRDVQGGLVRNVSVGYSVRAYEITETEGEIPLWRAVDWQPMELSAVPVGADPDAGFRSARDNTVACELIHRAAAAHDQGSDEMEDMDKINDAAPVAEEETRALPDAGDEAGKKVDDGAVIRSVDTGTDESRSRDDHGDTTLGPDAVNIAERAIEAERSRISGIHDAQAKLGVERSFADDLVKRGIPLDQARGMLIDEAAKRDMETETRSQITMGGLDERQTRRGAVEAALLHRFDPNAHALEGAAREWRGMSLLEMGRSFLEAEGIRVRGLSRDEIATRALHSTSDFPYILAGVANKTLRKAYDTAPRTFMPFCRQVSAGDFKNMYRVQLGEAPALEKVNESGEFKRGSIAEGQETYRVETYGKIFAISRQVLINDDLDAFTRVPQLFGTSAANLESDTVWGIFIDNPQMADSKALFHSGHKNLAGTGAKLTVDAIGEARAAMAKQTGLDGKTVLNIRPFFVIVPASLEMEAEKLVAQNLVPGKTADVVPASIRTLAIIAEARLDAASAIAWYMAANPSQIDTIEYAYLEGQAGVYIETRVGFDVDGVEVKARLDFGAKAIDWRGLYRNPGSAS